MMYNNSCLTENFVKVHAVLHIPADDILCICGREYTGNIFELQISDALKQRFCKICFSDLNEKEQDNVTRPANANKRRTPLATW